MNDNIEQIMSRLPENYAESAFECGAIKFFGKSFTSVKVLMLTILRYLQGLSLLETVTFARVTHNCQVSDVGFMKKFRKCAKWLAHLARELRGKSICAYKPPKWMNDMALTLVAFDASDVVSNGKCRQTWRLHYAIDVFSMAVTQFKLTTEKIGESVKNFDIQKNWLVVCDRVYGTITGIEHILERGGHFILRMRHKAFNVYDAAGRAVSVAKCLSGIEAGGYLNLDVFYKQNGILKPIRFCVYRMSPEVAASAERKALRQQSKKQIKYSDDAMFMHNFVVVLTSLPHTVSAEEIIAAYRFRWQIEIYFKRLKSILGMGNIPNKTPENIEAWLYGKILYALLIDAFWSEVDFSPDGDESESQEHMARNTDYC